MATKVAIIYYSATGTLQGMAERLASTAESIGAEVRLRHVAELVPTEVSDGVEAWAEHRRAMESQPVAAIDDILWADVVLFGSPTRYGNIASQLKQYIDSLSGPWSQGQLADKVYAGFTASQTAHGGQETTLLALYTTIHHFGGLVVSPGYTDPLKFADGNPYGVGKVTGAGAELDDNDTAALDHLVTRAVRIAAKLSD